MATTYYVNAANGDDTNTGTSSSSPFKTLGKAVGSASAGDTIYATGTETLSSAVSFTSSNQGNDTSGYCKIIGVNSSWTNDGTRYVLDANDSATNCLLFDNSDYWYLENIECKNATDSGIKATNNTSYYCILNNVISHDNDAYGFNLYYAYYWLYFRCSAYSNLSSGFYSGNAGAFILCSAYDNSKYGFDLYYAYYHGCVGCIAYDNTKDGFYRPAGKNVMTNCVAHGNGYNACEVYNSPVTFFGCRFTGVPTSYYGITGNAVAYIITSYFQQNGGTDENTNVRYVKVPTNGTDTNTWAGSDTNYGYNDPSSDDYSLTSSATKRGEDYIEIP